MLTAYCFLRRNRLLCLCFGLEVTLDEAQDLLRRCGHAPLYSRDRRDAVLIFGIAHGLTLFEINDMLFAQDEEALF